MKVPAGPLRCTTLAMNNDARSNTITLHQADGGASLPTSPSHQIPVEP